MQAVRGRASAAVTNSERVLIVVPPVTGWRPALAMTRPQAARVSALTPSGSEPLAGPGGAVQASKIGRVIDTTARALAVPMVHATLCLVNCRSWKLQSRSGTRA